MTQIFLSHAKQDAELASQVHRQLTSRGWGEVFLDIDSEGGIRPGEDWRARLGDTMRHCVVVVFLVSREWIDSAECRAEFALAEYLRKDMIPVRLDGVSVEQIPPAMRRVQSNVLNSDDADFLVQLEALLNRSGLSNDSFRYNPSGRPDYLPYRGLVSLEGEDAAIFCGRDLETALGVKALREAASSHGRRQIVSIKGPSGSGKSSLLKAGILPRIAADRKNYIVVPPITLSPAAMSLPRQPSGRIGLAAALCEAFTAKHGSSPSLFEMRAQIGSPAGFVRVLNKLRGVGDSTDCPVVFLCVDQMEEALSSDSTETAQVIELLDKALAEDLQLVLVSTMRADAAPELQAMAPFAGREETEFKLAPIGVEQVVNTIEGPGRAAIPPLRVKPELVTRLVHEFSSRGTSGDMLSLLALTMHRLCASAGSAGELSLSDYEAMGGMEGCISGLVRDAATRSISEATLVNAVAPALVDLRRDGRAMRRIVPAERFSASDLEILDRLVDVRLIVRDANSAGTGTTYAIAHEALFSLWKALSLAIHAEKPVLQALEQLRESAEIWTERKDARTKRQVLIHDRRSLRQLIKYRGSVAYADRFTPIVSAYIKASWNGIWNRRIAAGFQFAAAAVILVSVSAVGLVYAGRSWANGRAASGFLVDAPLAIAATAPPRSVLPNIGEIKDCIVGGPARDGDCLVRQSGYSEPIIAVRTFHDVTINGASTSKDGNFTLTFASDRRGVVWDVGRQLEPLALSHRDAVTAGSFLSNNEVVTGDQAGGLHLWRDGRALAMAGHFPARISHVIAGRDDVIMAADVDGNLGFFDPSTLARIAFHTRAHGAVVTSLGYDAASDMWYSSSRDGRVLLWSGEDYQLTRSLLAPQRKAVLSAILTDEHLVAAIESQGVIVWNPANGDIVARFSRHLRDVTSLAARSGIVVSGDNGGDVWIWKPAEGTVISGPLQHPAWIHSLTMNAAADRLLVGHSGLSAHMYELSTGREIARYRTRGPVSKVTFARGEEVVVVVDALGDVQIRGNGTSAGATGTALRKLACARPLNRYYVGRLSPEETARAHPWPIGRSSQPCDWRGIGPV